MNGNSVTLVGNVTADPEHFSGKSEGSKGVTRFSLACNRRWTDAKGEQQEEVSFFDVVAFGDLAENVLPSIHKGMRVMVEARANQSSWTDKETEKKRSKVEFIADEIGVSLRWATVNGVTKTTGPGAAQQALASVGATEVLTGDSVLDGTEPY